MKNTKVDYLVIGAGLSGLVTTRSIEMAQPQLKGLLVESGLQSGGSSRPQSTALGLRNQGFRQLPATELSNKAIQFLERLLDQTISCVEKKSEPVTFQEGNFKSFVGFGESTIPFYSELSYFLKPNILELSTPIFSWPELLAQKIKSEIRLKSEVTKIQYMNNVFLVTINGQHTIEAQKVISTLPLKSLIRLLDGDLVPPKLGQKISKLPGWTAVHLDLVTKTTFTDSTELHVLFGQSAETATPIWGSFEKADGSGMQFSQWMTLVPEPDSEDPEVLGQALKNIRRQLKRAYPELLASLEKEKIIVQSGFGHEGDVKLSSAYAWPKNENLLLANGKINAELNILGLLLQAELVTAAFEKSSLSKEEKSSIAELSL